MAASSLRVTIIRSGAGSAVSRGVDAGCSDGGSPADFGILAFACEQPRVLHRPRRCRRFSLREQRTGEDTQGIDFVVAGFLFLKELESLSDRGFLLGGRTRLFERQIRKRELSLGGHYLIAVAGAEPLRNP